MKLRLLLPFGLIVCLAAILIITEAVNSRNKHFDNVMSWNLIEADGTYHWRDPVVFIAMMITMVILILATLIWMNRARKGKNGLFAIPLILLYLASPWIQSALVGAYIVVYSQTYPGATMHLNYSIDWATPVDKVITFLSPPLIAFILGLWVWMNTKGRAIK